ncbi:MAG: hypothetical protein ACYDH8_15195 [Syntrophales bacterium]
MAKVGTYGIAVSNVAAVGVSLANINVAGRTLSHMDGTVLDADNLSLKARFESNAQADAVALSGGILAGAGADAEVAISPTIGAWLGSGNVSVSENVTLVSESLANADADSVGVSIGVLDVGVSLAKATVTPDINTSIAGGTVAAGQGITLTSRHNLDENGDLRDMKASAHATAPSGALLGSGAGADATADASAVLHTFVDTTATLTAGGDIKVESLSNNEAVAKSEGIAASLGLSVGASLANAKAGGTTRALMNGAITAAAGTGAGADNLIITAEEFTNANARALAVAGGLVASGAGADARATASPTVEASVGDGSRVSVTGAVHISATATPHADAKATGVSVSGGIGIGASVSAAEVSPLIVASVGSGAMIAAHDLLVTARQGLVGEDPSARADAVASGGGMLLGVNATISNTTSRAAVSSFAEDNSSLLISGTAQIKAVGADKLEALATGVAVGVLAAGANAATADSATTIHAYIGDNVLITGTSLILAADGTDDNFARSVAGSGGVVSGNAAVARTINSNTTEVSIGGGTADRKIAADTVQIDARHTAVFNAQTDSISAGIVGASGAAADNQVDADVSVTIGADAMIDTRGLIINALNTIDKDWLDDYNVSAGSGGVFGGAAALSTTEIADTTTIQVGDGACLQVSGDRSTPGQFLLKAVSNIIARDKTRLDAGGAIAVAGAGSVIENKTHLVAIQVGASELASVGDLSLSAYSTVDIEAQANAKTYGVAGSAEGFSKASTDALHTIQVQNGAVIRADGDISLRAGSDPEGQMNNFAVAAYTDLWNKTLIPMNTNPVADGVIHQQNRITIENGAWLGSAGDTCLFAEKGTFDADGVGTGKDLYREAGEGMETIGVDVSLAISGGNGGVEQITADVVAAGVVEVGLHNNQVLLVADTKDALPASDVDGLSVDDLIVETINGKVFAHTDGMEFSIETGSDLLQAIDVRISECRSLITTYRGTEAEARFKSELEILELLRSDLASGTTEADFINVADTEARSADITIRGDSISGQATGRLVAPGDARIVIRNATAYYLRTGRLLIPEYEGGNIRFNYRPLNDAERAGFDQVLDAAVSDPPEIIVENTAGTPNIEITEDIRNLNGRVSVSTGGSIYIWSSLDKPDAGVAIEADSIEMTAGEDFIQATVPLFSHVSGLPRGSWEGVTRITEALKTDCTVTEVNGKPEVNWTNYYLVNAKKSIEDQINQMDGGSTTSLIAGNRIFIGAVHLNINGTIQSGLQDKFVTLPGPGSLEGDTLERQIQGYDREYHQKIAAGQVNADPLYLLVLADASSNIGNSVYYNAREDRIEVRDLGIQGGSIQIFGDIMSTGSGRLNALDGFGRIRIENRTSYDLLVNHLDAGSEIEGEIRIVDTAGEATRTTVYRRLGDDIVVSDGSGSTIDTLEGTSTASYEPLAGLRYRWVTGQSKTIIEVRKHSEKSLSLFGADLNWLMSESANWSDKFQFYTDQVPLMQGEYYVEQAPAADFIYHYGFQEKIEANWTLVPQNELGPIDASITGYDFKDHNPYTHDDTYWEWEDHGWDTFLGHVKFLVYVPIHESSAELVFEQKNKDIHTHTIAADRAIGIEFSGYDSGRIDVISSEDLLLAGSIRNDSGTTTLLAQGAIEQPASGELPVIRGTNLLFYAGNGIGNDNPVRIRLDGGVVTAQTASGDIRLEDITGDLTFGQITIPHFDPFAGPGKIFSFVPAKAVDSSVFTIELEEAHGLRTGDTVTYSSADGRAVGGLTGGDAYRVLVVNPTTVMLAPQSADPAVLKAAAEQLKTEGISAVQKLVIHLDHSLATGVNHRLMAGVGQPGGIEVDLAGTAGIADGIIDLGQPHGFYTGQAIVYTRLTGDPVSGLQDGGTYYVYVVDENRIRLAESRDALVSYLPVLLDLDGGVATGFDHRFDPVDGGTTVAINPFTVTARTALSPLPGVGYVDYLADRIELGYAHGLTTGTEVAYVQGNAPITGLIDGQNCFVIARDKTVLQLALTENDALNNRWIDLRDSEGKNGRYFSFWGITILIPGSNIDKAVQPQLMVEKSTEKASFAFDPVTAIGEYQSAIHFSQAHLLTDGEALVYHCTGDGDPIDNLVDGGTYVVKVLDATTIKLKNDMGQVVSIGVPTNPAGTHTFTRNADLAVIPGSPNPLFTTFDPSAGALEIDGGAVDITKDCLNATGHGFASGEVVLYRKASAGTAIGGLTDGGYYTIDQADAGSFKLSDGATIIDLTSGGSGNHTFYSAIRLSVGADSALAVGDAVQYQLTGAAGATIAPIGGLKVGNIYFVIAASQNTVQLADTSGGDPILLDVSGTTPGDVHQFIRQGSGLASFDPFAGVLALEVSQNSVLFDPSRQTADGLIVLDHPFVEGQQVVYESRYRPIGGLQDTATYVVDLVATNTIRLKSTPAGDPILLDFDAATGTGHSLSKNSTPLDLDFSLRDTCVVMNTEHGFVDGQQVIYENDAGAASEPYYVRLIDARTLQLSSQDGGEPIRLDFAMLTGAGHRLTPVAGGTPVAFDPSTQGEYVVFAESHLLDDNDTVAYSTPTAAPVGGLIDGGIYTVAATGKTSLQLKDADGNLVALDYTVASGACHILRSLTAIVGAYGFVEGQEVVYHQMDSAGVFDSGSSGPLGLYPGETYTIKRIDAESFSLTDANGALVALDVDPTPAGQEFQCSLSSKYRIDLGQRHSYAIGEEIQFVSDSGTAVDGLTASGAYFVSAIDETGISLSETPGGDPMRTDVVAEFALLGQQSNRLDTNYGLISLNRIDLGRAHGLHTGDEVVYKSGGDNIGLQDGQTYFVEAIDATTVRLFTSTGDSVSIDWSAYSGSEQHFNYPVEMTVEPATAIDNRQQTISLDVPHGMKNGDKVIYHSGGAAIGGLMDGGSYYVDVVTPTTLKLAESLDDISSGSYILLDPNVASGDGHRLGVLESGAVKTAADSVSGNAIKLDAAHGLVTGQEVIYHSGVGNAIGGLTDGASYFVVVVDATTFKLAKSQTDIFFENPDILVPGSSDSGTCRFVPVQVPTGALGDVELIAQGSILPQDSASVLQGGLVKLTANGTIGNENRILRLNTAESSESGLSVLAVGDVFIEEMSGHLNLISAQSLGGDAQIQVADGALRDSNRESERDVRAIEELAQLWDDMNLTGAAAEASAQQTAAAYAALREREYHTYWRWRNQQDDPSVFDPDFQVKLSDIEAENYRQQLGWDDTAIANIETQRSDEYRTLHEIYGALGDIYNPDWIYDASASVFDLSLDPVTAVNGPEDVINLETHILSTGQGVVYRTGSGTPIDGLVDGKLYFVVRVDSEHIQLAASRADAHADAPLVINIDASDASGTHRFCELEALQQGSAWSEEQLLHSVGAGWLKKTTDTVTRIESSNVQADRITLVASKGIGADLAPIVIDLSSGMLDLTEEQKVALVAAERRDMTFIDADRDIITFGSAHNLQTGDAASFPGTWRLANVDGLTEGQPYYAVAVDPFTLQLTESVADALAGTGIVDLTRSETRIFSHEDINLQATGAIEIISGSHIYLGSESDLSLERIQAGSTISIKGGQGITSAAVAGQTVITGGDLTLEAAGGSIGAADHSLLLVLSAGARLTARAEESIYLTASGDLPVDTVYVRQDAALVASGGIFDADCTDLANISAGDLYLSSGAGIGLADNFLEVDLDPVGRLKIAAGQDVFIRELFGDMNLERVTAGGDVHLTADVSILGQPGDVQTDISGNSLALRALLGGIGAPGDDLEIDSAVSAPGALTAFSQTNSCLLETAGDLSLRETSSVLGTIFIAGSGRILNGNPDGDNVTGGATHLFAVSDIGADGNPLRTAVGNLEGTSETGRVWLHNTGYLTVGGVTADDGIKAAGKVTISASSPVTVAENIQAPSITITSFDDDNDGPGQADDLVVVTGVTLDAVSGSVILRAGDNLTIQEGAVLNASDMIELHVDYGNADPDRGGILYLEGELNADSAEIYGDEGDDIIDASLVTGDAELVLIGGAGKDTLTGGTGHDFIFGDNAIVVRDENDDIQRIDSRDTDLGSNDILKGHGGDDVLVGGYGADVIESGDGNDIVIGDNGALLFGSNGSLNLIFSISPTLGAADVIVAGNGNNVLIGGTGGDRMSSGSGKDVLVGDGGAVALSAEGLCYVETIDNFIGGSDFIDGGPNEDIMFGGAGKNTFVGTLADDIMVGSYGRVTFQDGRVTALITLDANDILTYAMADLLSGKNARSETGYGHVDEEGGEVWESDHRAERVQYATFFPEKQGYESPGTGGVLQFDSLGRKTPEALSSTNSHHGEYLSVQKPAFGRITEGEATGATGDAAGSDKEPHSAEGTPDGQPPQGVPITDGQPSGGASSGSQPSKTIPVEEQKNDRPSRPDGPGGENQSKDPRTLNTATGTALAGLMGWKVVSGGAPDKGGIVDAKSFQRLALEKEDKRYRRWKNAASWK